MEERKVMQDKDEAVGRVIFPAGGFAFCGRCSATETPESAPTDGSEVRNDTRDGDSERVFSRVVRTASTEWVTER